MVTERWGYAPVGSWGRPELYDLAVDPLAAHDIAAGHQALMQELHAMFLEHLAAHGASDAFLALWQDVSQEGAAGGIWAIDYPQG
jgi:hypothetical protein